MVCFGARVIYNEIRTAFRRGRGPIPWPPKLEPPVGGEVNKPKPLIPPDGSPMTIGASPQRLQANRLVAGLTHTQGGVRSRPMPNPTAVPRGPLVQRTAQLPSSHVHNSSRAELDQFGLTALRPMVDLELQ